MVGESEMILDEIRAVLATRSPCYAGCPGWGVYNGWLGPEPLTTAGGQHWYVA